MSKFTEWSPRLSAHRLALVAVCGVAGVALVAAAAAVAASSSSAAAPPGLTVQVVNNTKSSLPCCAVQVAFLPWAMQPQGSSLAVGATDEWVARLDDEGDFGSRVDYGGEAQGPGFVAVVDGTGPLSVTCEGTYQAGIPQISCQVHDATKSTPWVVT